MNRTSAPRIRWGRIVIFYAIAFGWAAAVAAVLYLLGQRNLSEGSSASWVGPVLAVGYMPVPLVAALIMERLDGNGYALRTVARRLGRRLVRLLVVAVAVIAAVLAAMVSVSWLAGNVLGVNGAGRVLVAPADIVANVIALGGASVDADQVAALNAATPGLWVILLITLGTAVLVGFTVNGLFAFGEEYGWRGWLADELAPLGAVRANLITGVLWGLWHAPVILLGYNYGGYRLPGVVLMILWCTAGSFLLWRARQVVGSVLAPAVIHGGINGMAGVFLVIVVDRNSVVAAPMGVVGIASVAVVAALFWAATRGLRPAGEVAEPEAATVE